MSYKPSTPPQSIDPVVQRYLVEEFHRIAASIGLGGGGPTDEPGGPDGALVIVGPDGNFDATQYMHAVEAVGPPVASGINYGVPGSASGILVDTETGRAVTGLWSPDTLMLNAGTEMFQDVENTWWVSLNQPLDEGYAYMLALGPTTTPEGYRPVGYYKIVPGRSEEATDNTSQNITKETWTSLVTLNVVQEFTTGTYEVTARCDANQGEETFDFRLNTSFAGNIPLGSQYVPAGGNVIWSAVGSIGGTIPAAATLTLEVYTNNNDDQDIRGDQTPTRVTLSAPGYIEGIT